MMSFGFFSEVVYPTYFKNKAACALTATCSVLDAPLSLVGVTLPWVLYANWSRPEGVSDKKEETDAMK
jgi:hypothetical protein